MKHLFLLLMLLCYQIPITAQDHFIKVAPRCGQEEIIKMAFSQLDLEQKEIYILHFRPGACPRCETSIWATASLLKHQNKEVLLVVDGDHQEKSENYIHNLKGLDTTDFSLIIYDTLGFYRTLIDYEASFGLSYPLLYKMDVEKGIFNNITTLAGVAIRSDWVQSITENKEPIPCKEITQLQQEDTSTPNTFWNRQLELNSSKITNPSNVNANSSFIYFTDATSNTVLIYDREGTQIQDYFPETEELYLDVKEDVEYRKKIQQQFIDSGIARVIYLDAYVDERGNARIPASIPDIWYEDQNSFYANSAVFIEKERGSNAVKNVVRFESKVQFNDTLQPPALYVVSHNYYQPLFENYFALPLYKGWPTRGYELDQNDYNNNPFDLKFYLDDKVIRIYKNNTEFTDIGSLPSSFKKNKLGYYFKISFYTSSAKKLYLFDKYSGEVQIFDKKDIEKAKNTFKIVQLFPQKNQQIDDFRPEIITDENKINLLTAYEPLITQSAVWDAKIDVNQNVCLLIMDRKNNQLRFQKYNSQMTKLLTEKSFPLENIALLQSATIQLDKNKIPQRIIGLEKERGTYYLKFKTL